MAGTGAVIQDTSDGEESKQQQQDLNVIIVIKVVGGWLWQPRANVNGWVILDCDRSSCLVCNLLNAIKRLVIMEPEIQWVET